MPKSSNHDWKVSMLNFESLFRTNFSFWIKVLYIFSFYFCRSFIYLLIFALLIIFWFQVFGSKVQWALFSLNFFALLIIIIKLLNKTIEELTFHWSIQGKEQEKENIQDKPFWKKRKSKRYENKNYKNIKGRNHLLIIFLWERGIGDLDLYSVNILELSEISSINNKGS